MAHSLGAVVVRFALLNAKRLKRTWINKCKMVLFGPAHNGARPQNLVKVCAPPFMRIIIELGKYKFPTIEDLETDSICLNNLNNLTESYLNKKDGDFTKAFGVIWALNDIVVYNYPFHDDPKEDPALNVNHKEVCKPIIGGYLKPLEEISKAII